MSAVSEAVGFEPTERVRDYDKRTAMVRLVFAALLAFLGLSFAVAWLIDARVLFTVLSPDVPMVFNTAVCLALSGIGLGLLTTATQAGRWGSAVCGVIVLIIAGVSEIQNLFDLDLGIDWPELHRHILSDSKHPGRMSMVTASTLLLFGSALALFSLGHGRRLGGLVRVLTYLGLFIGALAVLGHIFRMEFLYTWHAVSGMSLPTAIGTVLFGAGLMQSWRDADWNRQVQTEDERIVAVGTWWLVVFAVLAEVSVFALLQRTTEAILADGLELALKSRVDAVTINIELRSTRAALVANRPNLLRHLRNLATDPESAESATVVKEMLESFMPYGFTGIAILGADDGTIGQSGAFATDADFAISLAGRDEAELVWRDGFYLRNYFDLQDAAGQVGKAITEQRMSALDATVLDFEGAGHSIEMQLCAPQTTEIRCFPTRLHAGPFAVAREPNGTSLVVHHALAGGAGFALTKDYRAEPVIGAYRTLPELGLLAVLKLDTAELYAPIRAQFALALLILVLLVIAGSVMLRRQLQPLAAKLVHAEREAQSKAVELEAANRELTRLNRELENFTYSVSHDLRAPLRAITGFTEILTRRHKAALDEQGRHYLNNILVASRRMDELISGLLEYARSGRKKVRTESVSFMELLSQVTRELQHEIASAGLRINLPVAAPALESDPTLLYQILLNLISNAMVYRRPDASGGPTITVTCAVEGNQVQIEVADNGIGIAPEHQEMIFNVFQRLHSEDKYPGTGLGLATVRKAAELLGGTIEVKSTSGVGTTFIVRIPGIAGGTS